MQSTSFSRTQYLGLSFYWLLALGLTFIVRHHGFFWDTIQLGSLHAHFFYENNFSTILLPEEMDSGHPPLFGMYLAWIWQLFGKTLVVSHFAMLPFLWGLIYYLFRLSQYFFQSDGWVIGVVGLMIFDPCLAGQAALVSPDFVLVLFFLMSLIGILFQEKAPLILGIVGLCLISTRGMMAAAALFLFDFLQYLFLLKQPWNLKKLFFRLLPYSIGGLLGLAFLVFHYQQTGWIGYHADSPWAPAFEKVDFSGAIRNVLIIIWRILDFGRIFLVLAGGILVLFFVKNKMSLDLKFKQLILLVISLMIFLLPSMILHRMLSGHRYLLPLLMIINLIVLYGIHIFISNKKLKRGLLVFCFLGLATGNCWIYPKEVAQGWDATLAHLPYFDLRQQMIKYLDENNIPMEKVGSCFPNIQTLELIDLNNRNDRFIEKDLTKNSYIFYSNVFNDFTDEEIYILKTDWKIIQQFERNRISVILYGK